MMRVERWEGVELWLGDCRDFVDAPDPATAALLTDPPYGIAYAHGADSGVLARTTKFVGETVIGDDEPFDPSPWLTFDEAILWGANHYADRLPPRSRWLIWDKRDGTASNDLADCEMAWTNSRRPARLFNHRWMGMLKASERGDERVHPMQKPVALMQWCLSFVDADTVYDPYAGSASTAIACIREGRRFIGCEISPRYFDVAVRRIDAAINAHPLLDAVPMTESTGQLFPEDH